MKYKCLYIYIYISLPRIVYIYMLKYMNPDFAILIHDPGGKMIRICKNPDLQRCSGSKFGPGLGQVDMDPDSRAKS